MNLAVRISLGFSDISDDAVSLLKQLVVQFKLSIKHSCWKRFEDTNHSQSIISEETVLLGLFIS